MKHRLRSRFHPLLPAVLILALFWRAPVGAQSVEAGKDAALAHAADLDDLVAQMSNRLWDFAEIALEEHQSAGHLAEVLEDEGFSVETGVAGMPACTPTP